MRLLRAIPLDRPELSQVGSPFGSPRLAVDRREEVARAQNVSTMELRVLAGVLSKRLDHARLEFRVGHRLGTGGKDARGIRREVPVAIAFQSDLPRSAGSEEDFARLVISAPPTCSGRASPRVIHGKRHALFSSHLLRAESAVARRRRRLASVAARWPGECCCRSGNNRQKS